MVKLEPLVADTGAHDIDIATGNPILVTGNLVYSLALSHNHQGSKIKVPVLYSYVDFADLFNLGDKWQEPCSGTGMPLGQLL